MRVFLHPSKNEYLKTEDDIWVRNPCKPAVSPLNINDISSDSDKRLFLDNETKNLRLGSVYLNPSIRMKTVVIVSDGYGFQDRQEVLKQIPAKDTFILAVNGALREWRLADDTLPQTDRRRINYYIANNPYPQCLKYLPKSSRYCPPCIAASRTCPEFVARYPSDCLFYSSADEENFAGIQTNSEFAFDDYRNPVCAALSLAYRFRAQRVVLFGCDDSYDSERPGTVRLDNGLWSYPQQIVAQRIIDKMCFWLHTQGGLRIANCSQGLKYDHADYIEAEDIARFLHDEEQR